MSGAASKMAPLGSINNPVKYAGQDFEKLRKELLASGKLFEDPVFPAAQSSLGIKNLGPDSKKVKGLEWKRPTEIHKDPAFVVAGAERDDICQGSLADCWFLSSIACITMNEDYLARVVPKEQSFKKDYAGIFHFMFWQFGEWVDVVIDDRLPTQDNKLKFVQSEEVSEFWSALLEKAYAKINGSYESLYRGYPLESLQDFTGGVGEDYKLKSAPAEMFQKLQIALKEKSLICCSTVSKPDDAGLVANHAYSITGAKEVTLKDGGKVQLIRLRNPWGYKEWTGAWSDKSEEWNNVDDSIRTKLRVQKDDGEYWMAFPDFQKEYSRVDICDISLSETCCGDNCKWLLTDFNGSWITGKSSGGKLGLDTFWMNPQFPITLAAPDGDKSKERPMVVCLTQKDRRKKILEGVEYPFLQIGFYIFKVNPEDKIPLGKEFFMNNNPVARMDNFTPYHRDATGRFQLLPGDYIIVAATQKESYEADFYLRVFTEKPSKPQYMYAMDYARFGGLHR